MKSSYIPMMLLIGVIALFALVEKDKGNDAKFLAVANSQFEVAPVAPSEVKATEEDTQHNTEEEVTFKCKKEAAPKTYDLQHTEKK